MDQDAYKKALEWVLSGDTGVSSKTILSACMGVKNGSVFGNDVPRGPSDFGRCYRLLEAVPEIKSEFKKMAAIVPKFGPYIEAWEELEAMYTSGDNKMRDRMREIWESIHDKDGCCYTLKEEYRSK